MEKKIGEIEALHKHPVYHTTIFLRCRCGNIMDVFEHHFVVCRNCGRGFYLASPDGDKDAKERWEFAIREKTSRR